MNENKENIKVLSKEDVIKLSNAEKRIDFLESYQEWGVWLEIPELMVRLFKAAFPTGEVLYVTEYQSHNYYLRKCPVAAYRFIKPNVSVYGQYADTRSEAANKIKDLKVKYCTELKKK